MTYAEPTYAELIYAYHDALDLMRDAVQGTPGHDRARVAVIAALDALAIHATPDAS